MGKNISNYQRQNLLLVRKKLHTSDSEKKGPIRITDKDNMLCNNTLLTQNNVTLIQFVSGNLFSLGLIIFILSYWKKPWTHFFLYP